jgi:hypothetical protein
MACVSWSLSWDRTCCTVKLIFLLFFLRKKTISRIMGLECTCSWSTANRRWWSNESVFGRYRQSSAPLVNARSKGQHALSIAKVSAPRSEYHHEFFILVLGGAVEWGNLSRNDRSWPPWFCERADGGSEKGPSPWLWRLSNSQPFPECFRIIHSYPLPQYDSAANFIHLIRAYTFILIYINFNINILIHG